VFDQPIVQPVIQPATRLYYVYAALRCSDCWLWKLAATKRTVSGHLSLFYYATHPKTFNAHISLQYRTQKRSSKHRTE